MNCKPDSFEREDYRQTGGVIIWLFIAFIILASITSIALHKYRFSGHKPAASEKTSSERI